MKKSLNLLGSAQAFGFGGITELAALEGALYEWAEQEGLDVQIDYLDNPQLHAVLQEQRRRFHLLPGPQEGENYLRALIDRTEGREYQAVLSSYDTAAIFLGWFNQIPTFLYDGMLWFWDFEPYRDRVPTILNELEKIRTQGDTDRLVKLYMKLLEEDYHLTMLVAYHLADRVFARGAPQIRDQLDAFPEFQEKVQVVGAMIDPSLESAGDADQHVLVSLSGSLAPTLSFDKNVRFARGALNFAHEASKIWGDELPWIFSCHPRLYQVLKEKGALEGLPKPLSVQPSFPYMTNLKMIRDAQVLFASPGFSSVQEAAHFRTPLFFLPEQNGGQPTGFSTLRNSNYPTQHNLTVTGQLRADNEPILGEYDTDELYRGVDQLWSPAMVEVRQGAVRRFKEVVFNAKQRGQLIGAQRAAVACMIGGFDGARETIAGVLNHFNL